MTQIDYESAVEVAPGVWWVSPRPAGKLLYCNSYLLQLKGGHEARPLNLLIDPGGTTDFNVVATKTLSVIGDFRRLGLVTANHQDPDVVGSLPMLINRLAPQALTLMTEDTWRLVALTGVPKERVRFVERYRGRMHFPSVDRTLVIVPSPYCHFTGAFLIFDPVSGCLFTGDLFGGVTLDESTYELVATAENWRGIRFFHERYMPSSAALRWVVGHIRKLQGLRMICPQHGSLIPQPLIPAFLDKMEALQVGADLLEDRDLDDTRRAAWTHLVNAVFHTASELIGAQVYTAIADDASLMDMAHFEGGQLVVDKLPRRFAEQLVVVLTRNEKEEVANRIIMKAILEADQLELGTFAVDLASGASEPSTAPIAINAAGDDLDAVTSAVEIQPV